jgi:outer membrane lipoprotein-sorting protein
MVLAGLLKTKVLRHKKEFLPKLQASDGIGHRPYLDLASPDQRSQFMKRSTYVKLTFCILLVLAVVPVCVGQIYAPRPFSADMLMTTHNGTKASGKYYFSPPNFRMDMAEKGQNMSMITDGSTQTSYIVMHDRHMYIETHGNQVNPMMSRAPKSPTFDGAHPCGKDMTCQKVGTETVNGRVCDKWVGTDKQGRTGTAWIDQKLSFPIKALGADGAEFDLTNVKEGTPDASLFQPPAGYQKMDMGAMMGGGRPPQ